VAPQHGGCLYSGVTPVFTSNEDSHDCMTGEEFLGRNEEGDLHENLMWNELRTNWTRGECLN